MNVFTFSGRLARDAETRYTPNGKSVTTFTVANDTGYGDKKKTNWIRCSMWGDRGERIAEYLTKGGSVVVSGELSLNEYTGKDGNGRASLECRVSKVDLPTKRSDDETPQNATEKPASGAPFDDSVPF